MHDRFSVLKKKFLRVRAGMDSFSECFLFFWEYFLWRCKKNRPQYFSPDLANAWAVRRRKRTYCKGEYYEPPQGFTVFFFVQKGNVIKRKSVNKYKKVLDKMLPGELKKI